MALVRRNERERGTARTARGFSVTDAANHVTTYGYDTENNLTSITDANQHVTSFVYDAYGRVTQTNFPSSYAETYAYDAVNNLTSKTDRNGKTITYVYDALNRLTHKGYPDSTGVDYGYDLVGKIQQVNGPRPKMNREKHREILTVCALTRAVRVEYAAPVNTAAARIGTATTFSQALSECLSTLGGRRSKQEIAAWIHANYPGKWKPSTLHGHLYGCCVNKPKGIQHHPSFPRFLYWYPDSTYELYDATRHGTFTDTGYPAGDNPVATVSGEQEGGTSREEGNGTTFAYEAHLRDYLARNLPNLERGLSLWVAGSELESVEYEVGGRRIDILARDREGIPVIIELKVSRGHERTLGQCLYYRAELKRCLGVQRVRIMIVAQELTADLRLAATEISDIELFEYTLSMAVERVS